MSMIGHSPTPADAASHLVTAIVEHHAPDLFASWLRDALGARGDAFTAAYAAAGRRFRGRRLDLTDDETAALSDAGIPTSAIWTFADFGRAALLLSVLADCDAAARALLIRTLFLRGDSGEREALLRGLILLPAPEQFLPTAIEACRTSVQGVFEAIACENHYPARYFPEANFNQMVLKALFIGVGLRRIEGLKGRCGAELVRMAEAYGSERREAGRAVPEDIAFITRHARGTPA